jgi:Na+-transporting methylmalonyl-CoA/oxaloacetate decarboxylase gamma subunit
MAFFRQVIAPFLIVLVFLVALVAVSARIFLPTDMAAPAPVAAMNQQSKPASITVTAAELPPALSALVNGFPDDPALLQ